MRISDWSSDVCSSDLLAGTFRIVLAIPGLFALILFSSFNNLLGGVFMALMDAYGLSLMKVEEWGLLWAVMSCAFIFSGMVIARTGLGANRSEEHPSELQSLMRNSYAVFCLKKKTKHIQESSTHR